ncbi:MAG: thiamine pyrophosphate-binding protein [Caldilineaceae bacterium]|nr:thiamine pyrophosphate-binding protein [Caldilineaceae bacterium]
MHGGDYVADVLRAQGVAFVFTLTGGHIAPILVAAKARGLRVVDVRHEANAVFAADAVARLTGTPGVAVVTAGPGVTNTITAVKNAQMAQSPVVLLGGAAATALQGRGALQDIDQLSLFQSVVKWSTSVRKVRDLAPAVEEAFQRSQEGTPGPVFVEMPVDLLYDEAAVRQWYGLASQGGRSLSGRIVQKYLDLHVNRLFADQEKVTVGPRLVVAPPPPEQALVSKAAAKVQAAQRPVMLVGSQAVLDAPHVARVAAAVARLGVPVYLSGMARGLLGVDHPLQLRHRRRQALRAADLVLLAGVPVDFRLDYGRQFRRRAVYIAANRSKDDLTRNRKPDVAVHGDPGIFLQMLAETLDGGVDGRTVAPAWADWLAELRATDDARNAEIAAQAAEPTAFVNPLHICREIDRSLPENAILVADGGDFVATAAYTIQPRGPLTWLDPGPFGTLGVGAGFALGAKLARPDAEVWILYGDGSVGYSLVEFDTFVRHQVPVVAVVGNDAGWSQIAREQVPMLGDDVATTLAYADYQRAAEALGGAGFRVDDPELARDALAEARQAAGTGTPALLNVILGKSDFRKGSLSM